MANYLETVDILYTHIHKNIDRIHTKYTVANFLGHGVKGQGHGYINISKWLLISEMVDILYIIYIRILIGFMQGILWLISEVMGSRGQGYINILKWLIISETVDMLYTHIH